MTSEKKKPIDTSIDKLENEMTCTTRHVIDVTFLEEENVDGN